jgi:septum formation protein
MMFSGTPRIVLASRSPYRRMLLEQIGVAHDADPADIDESQRPGETPDALAARLAREKADAIACRHPDALIIGADQVACMDDGTTFGKPGDHASAAAQLQRMSGRLVVFHTAVCLLNARTGNRSASCVPTEVRFRVLSPSTIEAYLLKDEPYDCAASAKIERLGITLVERVTSDDPTALVGLPLIALVSLLAAENVRVV